MSGNEEINMADIQESGQGINKRKQCESFTIDFSQGGGQKENLQDAFLKFKRDKQKEIRNQKKMKRKRKKKQRNPQQMQRLRAKFVAQAKKYFGTPYAKRYWTPDDEEYYSKRFLDCCGLVRQVMLDLRKDFGFRIGPWNQAYMYDTLPITIEREEDMKAGDLVFISGIYPNPKSRQQKHHMTHVEIWAGNGCKTIGARWNKGKVQVFDHYKFQPKSFHSEQYYFKSIDTWLAGTCKSFCPEHKWRRRKFNPSKKSVFSLSGEQKKSPNAGPSSEKSDEEKLGQVMVEEEKKEMTTEEEGSEETEKAQMAEAEKTEEDDEFEEQDEDYDDDDNDEDDGCDDDEDYDDEDDDTYLYQEGDDGQEDEDDINATPLDLQSQILSNSSSLASLQNYDSNTRSSGATNQNTESIRRSNLAIETQLASKCIITDKNGKNINNNSSSASLDSVFSKATNSMLRGKGSQSCSQLSLASSSKQTVKETRDATSENKTEGATSTEPDKVASKADVTKKETTIGKSEATNPEKTDSQTVKHDSGLNPTKPDTTKDKPDTTTKDKPDTTTKDKPDTTKDKSDTTKDGATKETKEETSKEKSKNGKKSPHVRATRLPACSLPVNMQPTFYVGGGNGVSLVEAPLLNLGWKRTNDKYDERFRLKWVECKTRINYSAFKEGEQLVNHIPNGNLLTNKLGLLNSLQEYERVTMSTKGRPPRLRFTDFVPETYRFDEKHDREVFLERYKDPELWICKPTGMNQGKGIFIIRSREEVNKLIEEREQRREQLAKSSKTMMTRIVQKYITNPLLLTERKFDIRAYMLIASTTPYLVLYHKGYVRLCCNKYNEDSKELSTHLTNQFVQKKDPNYKDIKEDTAWSMDKFNQYINENIAPHKDLEQDWVYNTLTKQMQKIMIHCFNSVKHKLQSRVGFFDLFGLDFMVDTDFKIYLIEINVNPALHCNCEALKEVIPGVVEETLYVTIECFEKTRKNQQLLPLNSLRNFSILYCGSRPYNMPSRPSRSVSPTKDNTPQEKRASIPNTAVPTAPRSLHRLSTTSTPVVSAPPVVSTPKPALATEKSSTDKNSEKEKDSTVKKQPVVMDVHRVSNPNAKLSDMVSFSSSTLLAEAGNLLGQTSHKLDESATLRMIHGDEKQTEEDEKLKKEDSNLKEKAQSVAKSSEGVVLNLSPPEKQKTTMSEEKSSAADAVVSSTTKTTTTTSTSKAKPFVGRLSVNITSVPATSTVSSITKPSPGDTNSSATTSKPGPTEITPKPAHPYVIMTSTTSTNPIPTKNVSNFPLITNNGNKSARHNSNSQSLRSSKETSGKLSMPGGLSSNPYNLTSSLGKTQGSAVYLNTATTRSLNVTGSNALSTANSHPSSNSAKLMTVPSVTISEPGPKTIATLTLTSSRSGFMGRNEARSAVRRSRDRDKPDRGN